MMNRRDFNRVATLGTAALLAHSQSLKAQSTQPMNDKLKVHLFSKHLQFLDIEEAAEAAAAMGFDGLDLTVRGGGHVAPREAKAQLPRAARAIRQAGLETTLIASSVNHPEGEHSMDLLNTAAAEGFSMYRMAYYRFSEPANWKQDLDHHRASCAALANVNQRLGLHGAYQNHAGTMVGSYLPDLAYLMDGLDPRFMGCQFDIRHATAEGSTAWPLGLEILRDRIRTIVVKDFKWTVEEGRIKLANVPLGEGVVEFDRYFKLLRQMGIQPVVSLHAEYGLGGASWGRREITIPREDVYAALGKDLHSLHSLWQASA